MIAHIGRVMTSAAEPIDDRLVEHVIEPRHPLDFDFGGVEHLLAARDRQAVVPEPKPRLVQIEDVRVERQACWIQADRIVHANEEFGELQRERDGTARRVIAVENARIVVRCLRSEYASLERYDIRLLMSGGSGVGLRVDEVSRRSPDWKGWARARPT